MGEFDTNINLLDSLQPGLLLTAWMGDHPQSYKGEKPIYQDQLITDLIPMKDRFREVIQPQALNMELRLVKNRVIDHIHNQQ